MANFMMDDLSGMSHTLNVCQYPLYLTLLLTTHVMFFAIDIEMDGTERVSESDDGNEDDFMDFNGDQVGYNNAGTA